MILLVLLHDAPSTLNSRSRCIQDNLGLPVDLENDVLLVRFRALLLWILIRIDELG